jgi:antirestriction protein ArdC
MNTKIAQMVTDRLIAKMQEGIIPWRRPWTGRADGPISHTTGRAYSLLNQLFMPEDGEFITYNQAKKEGGHVKKGALGYPVVFWKPYTIKEQNASGDMEERTIPVLRYYTVFDIRDCEGIKPKYNDRERVKIADPDAAAEKVIADYVAHDGPTINRDNTSDRAFYCPADDSVTVPAIGQFEKTSEYYSTMFHELTHSTGHVSRLNRITRPALFGSKEYSKEELVAEIGAAALVNRCGLESESSLTNSAAYLQGWLKALKNDPTMIILAAGKAEKAVAYILEGGKNND